MKQQDKKVAPRENIHVALKQKCSTYQNREMQHQHRNAVPKQKCTTKTKLQYQNKNALPKQNCSIKTKMLQQTENAVPHQNKIVALDGGDCRLQYWWKLGAHGYLGKT